MSYKNATMPLGGYSQGKGETKVQRSRIEYLDLHWGPISGCLHTLKECPVVNNCWARAMANRFRSRYGPGFRPTFHVSRLNDPLARKKPARIGVSFMGDFCGPQVHRHWQVQVLEVVRRCAQHTFLFLTKNGEQLPQFNPWPPNAWVGVSITGSPEHAQVDRRNLEALAQVQAPVRWVSYEPVLGPFPKLLPEVPLEIVDWLVIGGLSGHKPFHPPEDWIQEVEVKAEALGIPVFEKNNLRERWIKPPRKAFPNK